MAHTIALALAFVMVGTSSLMIKAGARRAVEHEHQIGEGLSFLANIKVAIQNPWTIGGVLFGAMALAAYHFALKKFPVSLAYPIMTSIGYTIIVCGAAVLFSERLNVRQMIGVGGILTGVWIVASGMTKTA